MCEMVLVLPFCIVKKITLNWLSGTALLAIRFIHKKMVLDPAPKIFGVNFNYVQHNLFIAEIQARIDTATWKVFPIEIFQTSTLINHALNFSGTSKLFDTFCFAFNLIFRAANTGNRKVLNNYISAWNGDRERVFKQLLANGCSLELSARSETPIILFYNRQKIPSRRKSPSLVKFASQKLRGPIVFALETNCLIYVIMDNTRTKYFCL